MKSMVAYNGREIPEEDKVFAACKRANDAVSKYGPEEVINATVGALYDDEGKLIVFKSVDKLMKALEPEDYAAYAPIAGTPEFRKAILKAAFGSYEPKSYIRAVGTPGGTPAIRNAIANYSCPGDRILTHNWHWAPYRSIAAEMYRGIEHFDLFDEEGHFNTADFDYKVKKLTRNQEHLVIILNTPANNPTGYALTMEVRQFFSVVDNLRSNILPIIAYSASKTFTLYGGRCAAMICLAHSPEVAEEFEKVNSFSSRASWSNPPRAPQEVIERIYADDTLLAEVEAERAKARDMLLARGKAFEEEAEKCGLKTVPFSAGFFVTIPCADPDGVCEKLSGKNVFLIPFEGGVRASIAASSEDKCRRLPALIKAAMD